jgi:hypothetical protein
MISRLVDRYIGVLVVGFVVLAVVGAAFLADNVKVDISATRRVQIPIGYNFVEVDGMPCLEKDGYHETAITCDWSRWRGREE